jgi:hypothetical protein
MSRRRPNRTHNPDFVVVSLAEHKPSGQASRRAHHVCSNTLRFRLEDYAPPRSATSNIGSALQRQHGAP